MNFLVWGPLRQLETPPDPRLAFLKHKSKQKATSLHAEAAVRWR